MFYYKSGVYVCIIIVYVLCAYMYLYILKHVTFSVYDDLCFGLK